MNIEYIKKRKNLPLKRHKANQIIKLVNNYFDLDCRNSSRKKEIVKARQICFYLILKNIEMSTAEVGALFKNIENKPFDPATVSHGKNLIEVLNEVDKEVKVWILDLKNDAKQLSKLSSIELRKYTIIEEIRVKLETLNLKDLEKINKKYD